VVDFDSAIGELVGRCPGALGAAIVDPDGIPVASVAEIGELEELASEYATVIDEIERAERELEHGRLEQVQVESDRRGVVLTRIARGYFLVLLVDRSGMLGKARFLSRLYGERLHSEFV